MRDRRPVPGFRGPLAAAAAVMLAAACDTSIINPGPTPDEFLDRPDAHAAVVAGARRALSDALNTDAGGFILYWVGALSFELNPAGSTGSFGITPNVQEGNIDDLDSDFNWDAANEARFVAEDAIRRFNEVGASQALVAEVTLFAGYANRLLGETFCEAVLPVEGPDGELEPGGLSPHTDYFTRAEAHFTSAINLGSGDVLTAARAGRASVRAALATYGMGSWADAASDAGQVPNDFVLQAAYSSQDQGQFNALVWANGDSPYRAHTQWSTFAEARGFCANCTTPALQNDPRMPWDSTDRTGDAGVAKFGGQVPWFPQQKYPDVGSGVNLSSGWEMRLVEAEAELAAGNPGTAVDLLNLRRADRGLAAYDNTVSADSAGALIKLERQIELWLEGRRLADIRRWTENANSIPGTLQDGLYSDEDSDGISETRIETMFDPVNRSLCFPVGRGERETNPNVPL